MASKPPITSTSSSFLPLDALFDNPVFAGGIGLAGLGAAAALARKSVIQGAGLLKRRLLVDLEISKQDDSYLYVPLSILVAIALPMEWREHFVCWRLQSCILC